DNFAEMRRTPAEIPPRLGRRDKYVLPAPVTSLVVFVFMDAPSHLDEFAVRRGSIDIVASAAEPRVPPVLTETYRAPDHHREYQSCRAMALGGKAQDQIARLCVPTDTGLADRECADVSLGIGSNPVVVRHNVPIDPLRARHPCS